MCAAGRPVRALVHGAGTSRVSRRGRDGNAIVAAAGRDSSRVHAGSIAAHRAHSPPPPRTGLSVTRLSFRQDLLLYFPASATFGLVACRSPLSLSLSLSLSRCRTPTY